MIQSPFIVFDYFLYCQAVEIVIYVNCIYKYTWKGFTQLVSCTEPYIKFQQLNLQVSDHETTNIVNKSDLRSMKKCPKIK